MNIRCSGERYYGTAAGAGGPVSLYIHIPFCVRKCRYCDFLSGPAQEDLQRRYLDALGREIREKSVWLRSVTGAAGWPQVDTVFFGGGTPSLLSPRRLSHLMFELSSGYLIEDDAEITMECNPGTADYDKLRAFCSSGINRLSIGVQSFRDEELRLLGRIHTAQQARQCVDDARRAGFANVNLDLMSALPGQTCSQWMESLKEAVSLEPEHISAYGLILEEGTELKKAYDRAQRRALRTQEEPEGKAGALSFVPGSAADTAGRDPEGEFACADWLPTMSSCMSSSMEISAGAGDLRGTSACSGGMQEEPEREEGSPEEEFPPLPDEEEDRRMYHDTKRFLAEHGYHRYEISNYARPGFESRHNNGYWMGHPYLGFGLGASSYLILKDGTRVRWSNPRDMETYLNTDAAAQTEDILRQAEHLTQKDQMEEFMFLGLRRMRGVSERDFENEFGCPMEEVYGQVLKRYGCLGLLRREGGYLSLTDAGIDVSNTIMADFLL